MNVPLIVATSTQNVLRINYLLAKVLGIDYNTLRQEGGGAFVRLVEHGGGFYIGLDPATGFKVGRPQDDFISLTFSSKRVYELLTKTFKQGEFNVFWWMLMEPVTIDNKGPVHLIRFRNAEPKRKRMVPITPIVTID